MHRQSVASLLDGSQGQQKGLTGKHAGSLGNPPFDRVFVDRCQLALNRLIGLENEGVIQVSSPRRKEGRSSVAAAIALVLARTRERGGVLLVDLDFARPTQADLFSVAPEPGLADYLEGRERLRAVPGDNSDFGGQLRLITAGNRLGDPMRLIHLVGVDGMISAFRERFQWVVLDLPPMLSNPEVATLAQQVADWHLVVGRHRRTLVAELRKVQELLGNVDHLGFILTADSTRMPEWIRRRL
jgi:tyrosine-protein kinase Etk/Wzc